MSYLKCFLTRLISPHSRRDGILLRRLDPLHRLEPFLFPTRNQSVIYFREKFDVTHTVKYIQEVRVEDPSLKMTIFHILLAAMVRTAALKPVLNRFVAGKRLYQHKNHFISFMVKLEKTESARMMALKVPFCPTDTLREVTRKVQEAVERARGENRVESDRLVEKFSRLPGFVISLAVIFLRFLDRFDLLPEAMVRSDPFYATAFVSNLGSIGVNAPYHHLYEWGTVSIFVALGKYYQEWVLDEEGKPTPKNFVEVTFSIDERIADGFSLAQAFQLFKYFMEHPEELENPPKER